MRFLWWMPAVSYAVFIYWLSDQSQPPGSHLSPDKVLHFLGFGFFSLAVAMGLVKGSQVRSTLGWALGSFFIVSIYGCLDEFHQSSVAGRTASLGDILADSLGALVFLGLAAMAVHSRFRQGLS